VVIGTQASGQGHETSFAQVVCDLLLVPMESVTIITGDTDIVTAGGGSHSGRSLRHAATVMSKAAVELIAKARKAAAVLLDAQLDEVEFVGGRFRARHSNRAFNFLELARELARPSRGERPEGGLSVTCDNEMHDPVFPNGCAVCECEVDPETGGVTIKRYAAVDDVGRCINPMIVHGQTHGGIAQGVGQALGEACHLETGAAQPLSGSLMDYPLPRSDTLPPLTTEIVEVLSPTNPLGIKAGGEGATTPAPAAVINAIVDALRPLGIRDVTMPATPFTLWRAIARAKAEGHAPTPAADPASSRASAPAAASPQG
jgi:carbon-monoxide dehydrogenase large subunit